MKTNNWHVSTNRRTADTPCELASTGLTFDALGGKPIEVTLGLRRPTKDEDSQHLHERMHIILDRREIERVYDTCLDYLQRHGCKFDEVTQRRLK